MKKIALTMLSIFGTAHTMQPEMPRFSEEQLRQFGTTGILPRLSTEQRAQFYKNMCTQPNLIAYAQRWPSLEQLTKKELKNACCNAEFIKNRPIEAAYLGCEQSQNVSLAPAA